MVCPLLKQWTYHSLTLSDIRQYCRLIFLDSRLQGSPLTTLPVGRPAGPWHLARGNIGECFTSTKNCPPSLLPTHSYADTVQAHRNWQWWTYRPQMRTTCRTFSSDLCVFQVTPSWVQDDLNITNHSMRNLSTCNINKDSLLCYLG